MRGIFISYRRDDAEGQAGRLFDDLAAHFGRDAVFMDVAGIRKGLDFRRIIDAHVASCGVLLVIIGKGWLTAADSKGRRRLDDANDFVRLETAAALSRDIPVVPVLVHGADMPTAGDLPDGLKELAFRNGTEITHARWESDVKLLIEDLRPYLDMPAKTAAALRPAREPAPVAAGSSSSRATGGGASRRPLWAVGAILVVAGAATLGVQRWQEGAIRDAKSAHVALASPIEPARGPSSAAPSPLTAQPTVIATVEPVKTGPTPAQLAAAKEAAAEAAAAKAAAAKAAAARDEAARLELARVAAARAETVQRAADEQRKREEAERAQRAEDQRRRDEEARRLASEQAARDKLAAEQAAGAKLFLDIATTIIGSRQGNRN